MNSMCRVLSGQVIWVQFGVVGFTLQNSISDVKIFKRLLLPQFSVQFQSNFMESMIIRGEAVKQSAKVHGTLIVFNISKTILIQIFEILSFSNFMKLWNFTWESLGNHKMWNILKTPGCRAKWKKIWCRRSYELHAYGTFWVRSFEFSLLSFGSLCKIQFSMLRFSKGYCCPSFQSNFSQT